MEDFVWMGETWAGNLANRNKKIPTILWTQILKQMFERGKEFQKEIVSLSNMFSNGSDDIVNNSDEKNVISRYRNRNTTSLWLLVTGKSRVADHSRLKRRIESIYGNMLNVNFVYQRIMIYNWQENKHKTLNPWVDEKKQLLEEEISRHTSSGNQDIARLLRPQQVAFMVCPSGFDTKLNSTSVVVVTR